MHVIGTAGHVDHGKSTLVHALTGIDPDRLAEEKAREMTIDLGFAWLTLDGEEVGIVDVPGHRDFIENMLAGVGGIDLALFVIAADEGVMPQTREHLAILNLLEIPRGVIALTKTDLIDDPEWLELVTLEVGEAIGRAAKRQIRSRRQETRKVREKHITQNKPVSKTPSRQMRVRVFFPCVAWMQRLWWEWETGSVFAT